MISRADNSALAEWWRTLDKVMLGAVLTLVLAGFLISFAASPSVAERVGHDSFYFIKRHGVYMIAAVILLIVSSTASPARVRQSALFLLLISMVLTAATLFVGGESKGATRWLRFFGFSIQPSEFLKPAFVITCAWLFAENDRRPDIPGNLFAVILVAAVCALLLVQPDFGQTVLVGLIWGTMFFIAGVPWLWIIAIAIVAMGVISAAYVTLPHVAGRFDRFFTGEGDNFQVETAMEAILNGGWLGQGPGEGTVKRILPDGHADFPFAVVTEEFGIIAAIALMFLVLFIVLRGLRAAARQPDAFARLAISGLVMIYGFQSMIHFGVNLSLLPPKGMTLPFISYGGSSLMASALTMGFVLALTRQRPELRHRKITGFSVAKLRET